MLPEPLAGLLADLRPPLLVPDDRLSAIEFGRDDCRKWKA